MKKSKVLVTILVVLLICCMSLILIACDFPNNNEDNKNNGNENTPSTHNHSWDTTYSKDGTNHWLACSGCDEKKNLQAHTFVPKSDENDTWQECSVCKYVKDTHIHSWNKTYSNDSENHWLACSGCNKKKDLQAHTFVPKSNETEIWQECSVCKYIIDTHIHSWEYLFDETSHWQICDGCDDKKDIGNHSMTSKSDAAGTWKECSVCGYGINTSDFTQGLTYTLIDDNTFSVTGIGTTNDANIIIPHYYQNVPVTAIGSNAFNGCSGLASVTIPNSVTAIGDYAFKGCSSLTSIIIPDSVTSIGIAALEDCNNLIYNEYDNALYLGNNENPYLVLVKAKSTSITSCTINEKARFIMDLAFYDCSELTSIDIPNSVSAISNYAFYGCSGLTSLTIGGSVTSIVSSAFKGCSSLYFITIPNSVTFIGDAAFYGCNNLKYNKYDNALYLGNSENPYLVLVKAKSTSITSCIINMNTKFIMDNAFNGCSGLDTIAIPESVIRIGLAAFYGCSSLTSITLPFVGEYKYDNYFNHFGYIFGAEFDNNKNYVPSSLKEVIITGGESIGDYAFRGCSGLTSVTIPDSVTSIGDAAFYGCNSLTSITIPNSVTSIGSYAFYGCSGLTIINFEGTIAECRSISKGASWNSNTSNFTIICTDGKLNKYGSEIF